MLSCVFPSTLIHCQRLSLTFIPLSHLLLLTRTKGLPDQTDKKVGRLGNAVSSMKLQLLDIFLSTLYRKPCQNKTVFLVFLFYDESSSLATNAVAIFLFLTLQCNFKGIPTGHNGQKTFAYKLFGKEM